MAKYPSAIDYRQYKPMAQRYLELEDKLRALQAQEKRLRTRIYTVSNDMAIVSRDHLGYLGHVVVDTLREERKNAKRTG